LRFGDPLNAAGRKTRRLGVAAHSLGADAMAGVYVPRSPTMGVLYGVVRGHWSDFTGEVRDRTDGGPTPNPAGGTTRDSDRAVASGRAAMSSAPSPLPVSSAELMGRAFQADVLVCPRCGGRMVVLATIDDPAVIRRILTHLGLSVDPGEPAPGRGPPEGRRHVTS
jgi:hypothetical protein